MGYWIKFKYERNTFIIDLESISAFARETQTKRILFWLPSHSQQIILSPLADIDAYKLVLEFLKKTGDQDTRGWWLVFNYDRSDFFIDLYRIKTFVCEANGRLKFWLPDSGKEMIIHPQSYPEPYQKIIDYIEKNTGYNLP